MVTDTIELPTQIETNRLCRMVDDFRAYPEIFCQVCWPNSPLWSKQKEICQSVVRNKKTYVRSGQGVGKTHIAAKLVIWFLQCFKPSLVITTAPTFRQVESVLWAEIRKLAKTSRIPFGGELLQAQWKLDDDWKATGISTDDPEKFQGLHSPNILVVFDEAPGVVSEIYEAAEACLTSVNAKELLIGNPLVSEGPFFKAFDTNLPNIGLIGISCFEACDLNIPGLVTREWIEDRRQDWGEENPLWESRVLGQFPTHQIDTIISAIAVKGAINRSIIHPSDSLTWTLLSVDPSGGVGKDETSLDIMHGGEMLYHSHSATADPIKDTLPQMLILEKERGVNAFVIGTDGGGSYLASQLEAMGKPVIRISEAGKPVDSTYANVRAEMWFNGREEFNRGNVCLLQDSIRNAQLLSAKGFQNKKTGKIQVEAKQDIKARLGGSPDRADSVLLNLYAQKLLREQGTDLRRKIEIPIEEKYKNLPKLTRRVWEETAKADKRRRGYGEDGEDND